MLKNLFAASCMLLSTTSFAQYAVSGIVRDSKTHQSLGNATVELKSPKRYTLTDEFGRFRFDNVAAGTFDIVLTYIGYTDVEQKINVPSDTDLEIRMSQTSLITEAVVVQATRASSITPTTFTMISKEKLQKQNFGQDLPFLLNWTPSVVTTSDAGNGIGYTGIRIRGSDPTRINVTINGIPYNDSESAGTYWVDIPDIASSSQNIQVQRGVGTSTNGAGAFGGTINIQTNERNDNPYAEAINSFGSFRTRRHTVNFGTGLLNDHFVMEGRVSKISSDGFIDRATSDLQSYYFSGGYYSGKTILRAVIFGGKERTYQSWYGVPESRLNNDTEAMMITAMNEGWNEAQTDNLLNSNNRTFNPYLYKNQVDDYQQDHYQLHFSHQLGDAFTINSALHHTPGKGYYEEFRYNNSFLSYGLPDIITGNDTTKTTDLIRRRWLDNNFYGFTYSIHYEDDHWNIIFGGAWNRYDGDHFGEIQWAEAGSIPFEYRYYFNNGDKRDLNKYLKINYRFSGKLNAFADLQYRKVTYNASGIENQLNDVDIDAEFNFFNPKIGLTYSLNDQNHLYASYGIAHREPVREDYINFEGSNPLPETLKNLEIGFRASGKRQTFHANYYLMNYTNQLVLTGQLNDVGSFVRTNAGKSYRMGIELEGMIKLSEEWLWNTNITLSRNKIKEYKEVLADYGSDFSGYDLVANTFTDTDIAFSPGIIAGSSLSFLPVKNAEVTLLTKYVGSQYLDNTTQGTRSLNAYLTNDLRLSYAWKPSFVKEINFSFLINNILDSEYESNGFTYGYLAGDISYRENFYYPQAGRNFMGMIGIKW